ncbi:MAG: hypothetical protein K2H23_02995 [Oscillospiraceae bacterium]|nr:hypothetical protein [Oscillospiraceae bacterium]
MSSTIAGLLLFGALAALCIYNAVRCDKSIREFRKRGKFQKAEICSFQKRKEKTSSGVGYTRVTWYDITVKIELSTECIVTRTISTTSLLAQKYRKRTYADVAFIQRDRDPAHIEDLKIKEDMKSSPEFFLSVILFIIFSVIFVIFAVGLFIRI